MSIQDDETLRLYVEESLEHLADIENDFLAIEEAGADINEELVNKVFRAAHSIKGGAGFMGLNNIKELSHKMENVLGMIREKEMVPNSEIVNILLLASDTLRNLLNNVEESNEMNISEHIDALISLSTNVLSNGEKKEISNHIDISLGNGRTVFTIPENEITKSRKNGQYIYLVEYDLIHDIHDKDISPLALLEKMEESGSILASKTDIKAVGTLENEKIPNNIPFLVLFGTILDPGMINALFDVDDEKILLLTDDYTLKGIADMDNEEIMESTEPEIETEKYHDMSDETFPMDKEESVQDQKIKENESVSTGPSKGMETSLRVNISLLDSLMTLAGELVLGRNQLLQAIGQKDIRAIDGTGQRLDLITSELQAAEHRRR